jgi:predicted aldo/keto reductase-like oxidoreductase
MKTVELIPTWETALRIVSMRLGAAKTRKQMAEAVKIFEESFLPLCRAVDQRNEEIRKEREAKETPVVCSGCADTLPCGHGAEVNDEGRCVLCGGEGEI